MNLVWKNRMECKIALNKVIAFNTMVYIVCARGFLFEERLTVYSTKEDWQYLTCQMTSTHTNFDSQMCNFK
jgi:hypothetical protein